MGVTSSTDAQYSEYGLLEDGLAVEAVNVTRKNGSSRSAAQNGGPAGAATRVRSWRMLQIEDGDLEFTVQDELVDGAPAPLDVQIEWVSDPSSCRKSRKNALLKLGIREDEHLDFSFSLRALSPLPADMSISIACTSSPADLNSLLLQRKRSGVSCFGSR